jgi:hypothetical protein
MYMSTGTQDTAAPAEPATGGLNPPFPDGCVSRSTISATIFAALPVSSAAISGADNPDWLITSSGFF